GVVLALRAGQGEAEQPRPLRPRGSAPVPVPPDRVVVAADDRLRPAHEALLPALAAKLPGARLDGGVHLPDQRRAVGFDFALLTPGCRLLPRPGSVRVGMAALRFACARPRWRRRGWHLSSLVLGPPSPSPSPLRTGRLSRGSPGILRRVSGGCPGILRSLRGDVGG